MAKDNIRPEECIVYDLRAYREMKEALASVNVTPGPVDVLRSKIGKTAICADCPLNYCGEPESPDKSSSDKGTCLSQASFIAVGISEKIITRNNQPIPLAEIRLLILGLAVEHGLNLGIFVHGKWFTGIYQCVTRQDCKFRRGPDPNAA